MDVIVRYVGMWSNNKKNGPGIFYYSSGAVYQGNFLNDLRHGKGKIVFHGGSSIEESYEGDWVEDGWHGHGIYRYRNDEGTVYEGDWVKGVRHGQGKLTYKDGSFYKGEFQNNQMWGRGIYVGNSSSGEGNVQYEGEWRANMRQGQGTSLLEDGRLVSIISRNNDSIIK